ncbi:hypothetical protein JOM56_001579 [Amanita muscaria]
MIPDKRVVWHPRRDDLFVVGGGTQITLYELAREYPEIRHVTSRHDLHHMRCFAWSPDSQLDDLIAVGTTTGRVDLIRLQASSHARSQNPGSQYSSVLSTGPTIPLAVRNSRACNALSFSTADPNYLAVGLDKVRGDPSLVIWDLTTTKSSLQIPGETWLDSSVISATPSMTSGPTIPRAIESQHYSRTDPRILQQHATGEVVSALAFIPGTTHLLLAGISNRHFRFFDLRTPFAGGVVQGISPDPFEPYRIACWNGEEGIVTIWDARKLREPVLTFGERDASADGGGGSGVGAGVYIQAEWSTARRGTIATLEKDARFVRVWDVLSARPYVLETDVYGSGSGSGSGSAGSGTAVGGGRGGGAGIKKSWTATLSWPRGEGSGSGPSPQATYSPFGTGESYGSSYNAAMTLILSDTRRTKSFPKVLSSFALVPPSANEAHDIVTRIMVVNKEGDLELYAMHDATKQAVWSARGDLAVAGGDRVRIIAASEEGAGEAGKEKEGEKRSTSVSVKGGRQEESIERIQRKVSGVFLTATKKTQEGKAGREAKEKEKEREARISETKKKENMLVRAVEEDISIVMKQRAVKGYSIGRVNHNAVVINEVDHGHGSSETLSELWLWIRHSQDILSVPTPRLNGYDFSFQGLSCIWESFPPSPNEPLTMYIPAPIITHDVAASAFGIGATLGGISGAGAGEMYSGWRDQAYQLALQAIISRSTKISNGDLTASAAVSWRPSVPTQKALQRHVALLLCGWSVDEDDLMGAIRRWEREGNYPRAACWLVFMKQYDKATELLMRSDDEAHRMMSGTLAALIPSIVAASTSSSPEAKTSDLKMHCERMIVRLHDPYFRALLTHLTLGDWSEVLEEESLPFRERLAIAFQFLDDGALSTYLKRLVEQASKRGTIDSIMLTGLRCRAGIDVLQAYVDRTGDVQSAAILSALTWPLYYAQQQSPMLTSSSTSSSGRQNYLGYTSGRVLDARPEKWLEAYRDLLDGFKLFHCRVGFDIERGQVMNAAIQNGEVVMGHGGGNGEVGAGEWVPGQIMIRCRYCGKTVNGPGSGPTLCPHCNRPLPRCSICLMTLGVVYDAGKDPDSGQLAKGLHAQHFFSYVTDDGIVICQTCRHGGHATHVMEWFWAADGRRNHETCAVADCNCRCADES